jgi:membrane-bound lytic murein transglycosylase D
MAAYNCGAGAVDRAVERTGYADYWKLLELHALPKETANYVPIILAMTIMAKNPKDYGLDNIEEDDPIQYDNIRLEAATNIELIADAAQQPVSFIRDLNPALLNNIAPAGYELHVPKGDGSATLAGLQAVPAENRNSWRLHHVEAGETLEAIAREYHVTTGRIAAVNDGTDSLDAGDTLLIPAVYHPPVVHHTRTRSTRSSGSRSTSSHHASSHKTASRRSTRSSSAHISASVRRTRPHR